MRYLIDTDWLINALAGRPTATEPLDRVSAQGIAVSIITIGELYEGAFAASDAASRLALFRSYVAKFTTLPLTNPIMEIFAHDRALLRRQGRLIPDLDLLIAATALAHGLVLLTRNRRHFERILDLALFSAS